MNASIFPKIPNKFDIKPWMGISISILKSPKIKLYFQFLLYSNKNILRMLKHPKAGRYGKKFQLIHLNFTLLYILFSR